MPATSGVDFHQVAWLGSAVILGIVLQHTNGHYEADWIPWLIAAWGLAFAGVIFRFRLPAYLHGVPILSTCLLLGFVAQLYAFLMGGDPTIELRVTDRVKDLFPFHLAVAIFGATAGAGLAGRLRPVWLPILLVAYLVAGARILKLDPLPHIDVFTVERDSLEALLHKTNPYAITFPDPYGGASPFFPPGVSVGGRLLFGYVYMPLSLLMLIPGYLFGGDPRYSQLVSVALAAGLVGLARGGTVARAAAALFLFTPRTFFVIDRAWTDPFIVLLLAACLFVATRMPKYLFVPLGLLFCVKQQTFIGAPAVLLFMPRPIVWRDVLLLFVKAGLVAMAITLPFVLWDVHAFRNSALNLREVFRTDSLGIPAHLSQHGVMLSKWTGLFTIVPATALALWRAPRTLAGFAGANAFIHFTLYIFSTHCFCNEYFTVTGMLFFAVGANEWTVAA